MGLDISSSSIKLVELGWLFKTKSKKSIKKEMLVFITPKTLAERTASR